MDMIELVYMPAAKPCWHTKHVFQPGLKISDILLTSDIFSHHPEARHFQVGVFSVIGSWDTLLYPGDRVEIYRPLLIDPKEKRRQRAKKS